MAQAIDQETRLCCAELWIEGGNTYEQVSAKTGVSVGALKKWSEEEGWPEKRVEYREAQREIRANTTKLRRALINKALGSLNPQDVYAVTSLETIMARSKGKDGAAPESAPVEISREIKTPQEAIQALQSAVEMKVNGLLSRGDISLAAVKDLKQALELIEKMKERYTPEETAAEEKPKGLSDEMADDIRRKILGLST